MSGVKYSAIVLGGIVLITLISYLAFLVITLNLYGGIPDGTCTIRLVNNNILLEDSEIVTFVKQISNIIRTIFICTSIIFIVFATLFIRAIQFKEKIKVKLKSLSPLFYILSGAVVGFSIIGTVFGYLFTYVGGGCG